MVLVAAVDRSAGAGTVVRRGRELAEAFDEDLHVIHVLDREAFYELDRTTVKQQQTWISNEEIEATAAEIAAETVGETASTITAVGRIGDPAKQVVRYAGDVGARLIVIGRHKRSPVGKAVFGSVTQSVLLEATCPVVSVRTR